MEALFRWIWGHWRAIHEESLAAAQPAPPTGRGRKQVPAAAIAMPLDWKPIVILITTALTLTLQEYAGDRNVFARLVDKGWFPYHPAPEYWELWSFVWWTGWRVIGYLLIPMAVVACLPGERIRDYGWSFDGFVRHLKTYLILFALVMPVIYFCSQTRAFRSIYPFYRLANRSLFDLIAWELLYALQFLSLEFFFRGFMLNGLKKTFGAHSIWVMVVPYCMIHYGKTWQETVGAIFAGLILGTVALRTRSIWGGVLIHVGVALSMDLLTIQSCPKTGPCPR
jgi:membrane protease YdiL (CAAX protease family)